MPAVRETPVSFNTYVFDCDGVLLDTNRIKVEAFALVAAPYGADVAKTFDQYHRSHAGLSRFVKIRYLHEQLLGRRDADAAIQADIARFGEIVKGKLADAKVSPGLVAFLDQIPATARKYVISGAEQEELRLALRLHRLDHYFHGIFGSPDDKRVICRRLKDAGSLPAPLAYFGDSKYDHEVAAAFGCRFFFLSRWTDMPDWREYFASKSVEIFEDFTGVSKRFGYE